MKKALLALILIAALAGPLSACNTIEGIGRDTEAAGDALGDAARDNKSY